MARRGGGKDTADARPRPPRGEGGAANRAFTRTAVVSIVLLLGLCALLDFAQLTLTGDRSGGEALVAQADALAARVEVEAAQIRGGVLAAQESLRRRPDAPADAAETGLAATAGAARAIAILDESGTVVAVAGAASGFDWATLASTARRIDGAVSVADVAGAPTLTAAGKGAAARIIAVGDPARLAKLAVAIRRWSGRAASCSRPQRPRPAEPWKPSARRSPNSSGRTASWKAPPLTERGWNLPPAPPSAAPWWR